MKPLLSFLAWLAFVPSFAGNAWAQSETLWQRIEAEPRLSTFTLLAEAAGLREILASDGVYTVFAPSDAAFAAMPEETRIALLDDPEARATRAFLMRHVAQGRLEAQFEMGRESQAQMLSGETLRFAARFAGCGTLEASLDQAELLFSDLHATNGVLHVLAEPL